MAYRSMNYSYMLFETLRNYYSVNAAGEMSFLFKYMACFVNPLILPFNSYNTNRQISWLIAQCAWQIGQLTNVLNYLYDPINKGIYITQNQNLTPEFVDFGVTALTSLPDFGSSSATPFRDFGETPASTLLTFKIPSALAGILSKITATIAQVAISGITYTIQTY